MAAQFNGTSDNACDAVPPNVPDSQLVRDCNVALELQSNNEENEMCEYLPPGL